MKISNKNREVSVYRVKVTDGISGLVQVKSSFCLFFNFFFPNTITDLDIELNNVDILNYRFVATNRIKDFFICQEKSLSPIDYNKQFLMLQNFYKSPGTYGVNLVSLPSSLDMLPLKLVKSDLNIGDNYSEIIQYDLIGMIADSNKIKQRLLTYIETGIDFDDTKKFIFPDLTLPNNNTPPKLYRH